MLGFRIDDLSDNQRRRGGHDTGRDEVARGHPQRDIAGKHSSSNGGEPTNHDGEQFGPRHVVEKRFDEQRTLGLADKDIGGARQGLGAAGSYRPPHEPSQRLDDQLHDAEVVEDTHETAKEDDGGEHLEGKLESKAGPGGITPDEVIPPIRQIAEEETRSVIGQGEEIRSFLAEGGEDGLPVDSVDDQPCGSKDHDESSTHAPDRMRNADLAADGGHNQHNTDEPGKRRGRHHAAKPADHRSADEHGSHTLDAGEYLFLLFLHDVHNQEAGEHHHAVETPIVLLEDDQSKDELKAEPPDHRPHLNSSRMVGHGPRQTEQNQESDQTEKLHCSPLRPDHFTLSLIDRNRSV